MDISQALLLIGAAIIAGAINSVAGGGSFVSFPALLFAGLPPISANATNTTALWPGNAASTGAYRRELEQQRHIVVLFSVISLIGGLVGALLLLVSSDAIFERLIPYLMLLATVVFAASPLIQRAARRSIKGEVGPGRRILIMAVYLLVAIYGGFFGAGLGILTLAVLALLGQTNIHEMNALKTLQATVINGIAMITFIIAGAVAWPQALIMAVGSIIGGYGGAAIARKVPALWVRRLVIAISVTLTAYFFVK